MEYQPDLKRITGTGGEIAEIVPGSLGATLGLVPGDLLLAINGQRLRDVIDYRFFIAEERVELLVQRGDAELTLLLDKPIDTDLGIEFTEPLFDRLRTCNNKCPFCFLTQMPKGMRRSLYLKDDDYRLGFLYGNFVTLTNLTEADWERIAAQHLSPMYVSIHATDHALRAVLLGKPELPDVLAQIRRFGELGIGVHTQVVAIPGLNDGPALHQTIRELAALHPFVETIAVVPVGLTKYRFERNRPQSIRAAIAIHETPEWIDATWERQPSWDDALRTAPPAAQIAELGHCARQIVATDVPLRCYTSAEAAGVIDLVEPYAARFRTTLGTALVQASDEFYLLSGRELPAADTYDGMPQYSNGVGMTRDFIDGWAQAERTLPTALPRMTQLTLVCGTLIVPVLAQVVARLNQIDNLDARLLPVVNTFFGETVTVSGLLTGADVVAALAAAGAQRALLPRVMFDHTGTRTIDEYAPDRIAAESGALIATAGEPDELAAYVRALAQAEGQPAN
jgi:NifB/MoaA-like Fe-S oxidoreductase